LNWFDRTGKVLGTVGDRADYADIELSPDGTRATVSELEAGTGRDVWIFDLARATLQRLTFDPGLNRVPIWSRDGRRVAFSREIDGGEEVFWQAADGSGRPEPLTADSGEPVFPSDFSPDGKALLFNDISEPWETRVVSIDAPGAGTRLFSGAGYAATISPDGRWVAYESRESGRREVYVRPYPDVESGRWQISTNGGSHPVWRRDGRELFYFESPGYQPQGRGALMAAPIETDGGFHPGSPQQLFANNFVIGQSTRPAYDVSLDGERFLMLTDADAGVPDRRDTGNVIIVENWVAELERLVPTP